MKDAFGAIYKKLIIQTIVNLVATRNPSVFKNVEPFCSPILPVSD